MSETPSVPVSGSDREKAIQAVIRLLPGVTTGLTKRLWAERLVDAVLAALSPAEPVQAEDDSAVSAAAVPAVDPANEMRTVTDAHDGRQGSWSRFWKGRYEEQHRTVHALEDEIGRLRTAEPVPPVDPANERGRCYRCGGEGQRRAGDALVRCEDCRGTGEAVREAEPAQATDPQELPSPSEESRATTVSPGVDPCEAMASPAAGDASDSQHGLPVQATDPVRGPGKRCTICGDTEPFHVHNGDRRIEDYFTVGRGQSDFEAAQAWKARALAADREPEGEITDEMVERATEALRECVVPGDTLRDYAGIAIRAALSPAEPAVEPHDFEEAQRLLAAGDTEGLARLAARGAKARAVEAAARAREPVQATDPVREAASDACRRWFTAGPDRAEQARAMIAPMNRLQAALAADRDPEPEERS